MSDAGFHVLEACLVALLYLFLLRVVLLVARELRGTPAAPPVAVVPEAPTTAAEPVRRRPRAAWQLVVVAPKERKGESYAVDGEATIGRGGGCSIPLGDDTFVSNVHARAFTRDGSLWIEDLGSTNGTSVGGKRLDEPQELRRGDRVQVGGTILEARR
jgi:hypothetical protein